MPCDMMSGASLGTDYEARRMAEEAIKRANEVADILCRILRGLTPEQIAALDPDIQKWFAAHREHDRRQGRP